MIVYKLTFLNGKAYIGQTVRMLDVRLAQHAQAAAAGSLLPVHCAWRKHGAPAVEVLSEHSDLAALHVAEIAAIARCGTIAPGGYNVGYGGETAPSKNPEVAAKIAAKATGRAHSDDTRTRIAAAMGELWADPTYREKVAAGVDRAWTAERRAAVGVRANRMWDDRRAHGWKVSDETRAKVSAAMSNPSEDTRRRMSESAKARVRTPRSESTRAKTAASIARSWQDPEIRQRRADAIREGHRRRKETLTAAREG